ncbi:hypothetical protein SAMN04489726_4410 [Allokutzneria albata]|uniref:Uncharacterized protein n=1 Tax=Allokutzneria albata TaxID=211114 RepID=A0A1G9XUA7_ALLAB|nr:hypothetical protein SAMN04489726_4410 [Allokutzneria albata]
MCTAGRRLSLAGWLGLPLLFVGMVAGLNGALFLVSGAPVELSSAHFGAAAALAVATSGEVRWRAPWQRHWVRWPWSATLLVGGIFLHGTLIPAVPATAAGVLAAAVFTVGLQRAQRRERQYQEDEDQFAVGA